MTYTSSAHWDGVFQRLQLEGSDIDWGDQWTGAFIKPLRVASVNSVLDLGCGTGNDVIRLANAGLQGMGLDYSEEAIRQASKKPEIPIPLLVADMAQPLPFAASSFDAIMSNVAIHMFSDSITRKVFREIKRILRPTGLFLFHLNALEDRPLRAKWKGIAQEIEPNYVIEPDGQTMHFFSEEYLQELLANWSSTTLERVEILHSQTGEIFKVVWRGIAHK